MDQAGVVAAVDAAIAAESLSEVLARASLGLGSTSPTPSTVGLERAAAELRQRIVAEFLTAEAPDAEGDELLCSVPAGEPRGSGRPAGPARVQAFLEDFADVPVPTRVAELSVEGARAAAAQLACPQCRRPLELRLGFAGAGGPPAAAAPRPSERHAFCSVLCDGSRLGFLQALLLGQSLASSGSAKERLLLHGPAVPAAYLEALAGLWELRPLGARPRLAGRRPAPGARGLQLHALELAEYDKVILLELGLLVQRSVDALFGLECPAGVFAGAPPAAEGQGGRAGRRLDMSVLLLRPSSSAFRRMAAEVGSRGAVWPPRGGEAGGQGCLEDYLVQFYEAFFGGSWAEVPPDFVPAPVVEGGAHPQGFLCHVRDRQLWEALERAPGPGRGAEGACGAAGLLAGLFDAADARCRELRGEGPLEAARAVEAARCKICGAHDAEGTRDPIDHLWRCRFCWEGLLLEALLRDGCAMPLPPAQAEALRRDLGACHAGPGRQRWGWACGGQAGWIEFRPGGVLWTRDEGVGAWQAWGEGGRARVAIHLCRGDRAEVRHVLQLRAGAPGAPLQLDELYREATRPLGLCRIPVERPVHCWLLGAPRPSAAPAADGPAAAGPSPAAGTDEAPGKRRAGAPAAAAHCEAGVPAVGAGSGSRAPEGEAGEADAAVHEPRAPGKRAENVGPAAHGEDETPAPRCAACAGTPTGGADDSTKVLARSKLAYLL